MALRCLTGDEDNLLAVFNVSNQKSDTTIKAIITAVDTAVTEIAALIPPAAASAMAPGVQARAAKRGSAKGWKNKDFKKAYNDAIKGDKRFKKI